MRSRSRPRCLKFRVDRLLGPEVSCSAEEPVTTRSRDLSSSGGIECLEITVTVDVLVLLEVWEFDRCTFREDGAKCFRLKLLLRLPMLVIIWFISSIFLGSDGDNRSGSDKSSMLGMIAEFIYAQLLTTTQQSACPLPFPSCPFVPLLGVICGYK